MITGKLLSHNSFDILDLDETQSSLYRSPDLVRLSFKDENNNLVQYTKTSATRTPTKGDLLVVFNNVFMPTGDRRSNRTAAKLLANSDQSTQSKQITIGFTTYTLKLLPIALI